MGKHFIAGNFDGHGVPLVFLKFKTTDAMYGREIRDGLIDGCLQEEAVFVNVNHRVVFPRRAREKSDLVRATKLEVKFYNDVFVFGFFKKDAC